MAHVTNLTTAQSAALQALNELCGQGVIDLYLVKKIVTTADIEFEGTKGYYSSVLTVDARLGVNGAFVNRIEIFSYPYFGSPTDLKPAYVHPKVALIFSSGNKYLFEWRRVTRPKPYWFDESLPTPGDKFGWEDLRRQVNRLHGKLQRQPKCFKFGFHLSPGGVLNAYCEGDLSFADAVSYLQEWKKS
jgi:hypothetical protein